MKRHEENSDFEINCFEFHPGWKVTNYLPFTMNFDYSGIIQGSKILPFETLSFSRIFPELEACISFDEVPNKDFSIRFKELASYQVSCLPKEDCQDEDSELILNVKQEGGSNFTNHQIVYADYWLINKIPMPYRIKLDGKKIEIPDSHSQVVNILKYVRPKIVDLDKEDDVVFFS